MSFTALARPSKALQAHTRKKKKLREESENRTKSDGSDYGLSCRTGHDLKRNMGQVPRRDRHTLPVTPASYSSSQGDCLTLPHGRPRRLPHMPLRRPSRRRPPAPPHSRQVGVPGSVRRLRRSHSGESPTSERPTGPIQYVGSEGRAGVLGQRFQMPGGGSALQVAPGALPLESQVKLWATFSCTFDPYDRP